jgi:phosphoglycolate phosphatase
MTAFSSAPIPFATIGFDLDGTLLDTTADLAAAVNHALALAGRPTLTIEEVRPMIGGGSRTMLARALEATGGSTAADLDALLPRLLSFYEEHIAMESRPFPGCIAALDSLADRGVQLAVVTNKLERLAVTLLREVGLLERFATVIGGDTLGDGRAKPKPDLIELMLERCGGAAAFVGDTIYDVTAAKAAGVPVVVCDFAIDPQPPESWQADAVIRHFDELLPALEGLGSGRP